MQDGKLLNFFFDEYKRNQSQSEYEKKVKNNLPLHKLVNTIKY